MLNYSYQKKKKALTSLIVTNKKKGCSIPHLYNQDQMHDQNNTSFLSFDSVCDQGSPLTSQDPIQEPPIKIQ